MASNTEFLNDLPACFKHSRALMYADDLKLYTPVSSVNDCELLQLDIDCLAKWCTTWRLSLNVSKCNVLTFTNKKQCIHHQYKLNKSCLSRVSHIRDLGVIMDSTLSYNRHIGSIVPKAMRMLGFVKRNCIGKFSKRTVRTLYVALVRPQIDYATVIWNPNGANKTNVAGIERVQQRYIKYMSFNFEDVSPYHREVYPDLCLSLRLPTLATRREVTDLLFLFRLVNNQFDSCLLQEISFRVPGRRTRCQDAFLAPKPRLNIFKFSSLPRMQTVFNNYCDVNQNIDIHHMSFKGFRKEILCCCLALSRRS